MSAAEFGEVPTNPVELIGPEPDHKTFFAHAEWVAYRGERAEYERMLATLAPAEHIPDTQYQNFGLLDKAIHVVKFHEFPPLLTPAERAYLQLAGERNQLFLETTKETSQEILKGGNYNFSNFGQKVTEGTEMLYQHLCWNQPTPWQGEIVEALLRQGASKSPHAFARLAVDAVRKIITKEPDYEASVVTVAATLTTRMKTNWQLTESVVELLRHANILTPPGDPNDWRAIIRPNPAFFNPTV